MATIDGVVGPVAGLIDAIVTEPAARDAAKLELLRPGTRPAIDRLRDSVTVEARPVDPWAARARPAFLYVMYALLLWSIPMGLIAAVRPRMAAAIATGMTAYLNGIPEPLYALFATGYLGYTVARSWGKARGVER